MTLYSYTVAIDTGFAPIRSTGFVPSPVAGLIYAELLRRGTTLKRLTARRETCRPGSLWAETVAEERSKRKAATLQPSRCPSNL